MMVNILCLEAIAMKIVGSVMHLFNKCTYIYNRYESRKSSKKAFQTNGIEIKYNCAKRYHILWTN